MMIEIFKTVHTSIIHIIDIIIIDNIENRLSLLLWMNLNIIMILFIIVIRIDCTLVNGIHI